MTIRLRTLRISLDVGTIMMPWELESCVGSSPQPRCRLTQYPQLRFEQRNPWTPLRITAGAKQPQAFRYALSTVPFCA